MRKPARLAIVAAILFAQGCPESPPESVFATTIVPSLNDVTFGGNSWVAVGDTGALMWSDDPARTTWDGEFSSDAGGSFRRVAWTGARFISVGDKGHIVTSPDGIAWTPLSFPDAGVTLRGVAGTDTNFVIVGDNGAVIAALDGGAPAGKAITSAALNDVAFGNGRFVAVGASVMASSASGADWQLTSVPANFCAITFGGGSFAAASIDGTVRTSRDGVSWVPVAGVWPGGTGCRLTFGGGAFVLVSGTTALSSSDGVTWNGIAGADGGLLNGVGFGGDAFLAVGAAGSSVRGICNNGACRAVASEKLELRQGPQPRTVSCGP